MRTTIYDIKRLTEATSPYFFSRKTLKFFHQTMRDFRTQKQPDGRIMIYAPIKDNLGKSIGQTLRYFNPTNNTLEHN